MSLAADLLADLDSLNDEEATTASTLGLSFLPAAPFSLETAQETPPNKDLLGPYEEFFSEKRILQWTQLESKASSLLSSSDDICTTLGPCTQLVSDFVHAQSELYQYAKTNYAKRFPGLETLVLSPIAYVRCVQALGNKLDLENSDLNKYLTSELVMIVTVSAQHYIHQRIEESLWALIQRSVDWFLKLDSAKTKILAHISTHVPKLAPNLTSLIGPKLTASLITVAGGLKQLSTSAISSFHLLSDANIYETDLAKTSKVLSGQIGSHIEKTNSGILFHSDFVQKWPPDYRRKAAKLLGGKCSLAARIDFQLEAARNDSPDLGVKGQAGAGWLDELTKKMEKMLEAPALKKVRPLPVPTLQETSKRAGKRVSRMKKKYGKTEAHKLMNRMAMGVVLDDVVQTDLGYNMGMLNANSGRARAVDFGDRGGFKKAGISKKTQKILEKEKSKGLISGIRTGIPTMGNELIVLPISTSAPASQQQHQHQQQQPLRAGANASGTQTRITSETLSIINSATHGAMTSAQRHGVLTSLSSGRQTMVGSGVNFAILNPHGAPETHAPAGQGRYFDANRGFTGLRKPQ